MIARRLLVLAAALVASAALDAVGAASAGAGDGATAARAGGGQYAAVSCPTATVCWAIESGRLIRTGDGGAS